MSSSTKITGKVILFMSCVFAAILAAAFAGRFSGAGIKFLVILSITIAAALFFIYRATVMKGMREVVGEARSVAMEILDADEKLKQLNTYLDGANSEIKKLNKETSAKHRETEMFVYRLSNDFLGPLSGVENMLSSIKKSGVVSGELVEQVNRNLETIRFMTSMVNDLLHLAKSGNIKQENVKVDLMEISKRVQSIFHDELLAGGFDFKIIEPLEFVFADKNRVFEIIENLVSNSIKFRKENVKPSIEIGVKDANEKTVTLYVKDNGIGIAEEHQEAVFKMFYSVKETEIGGGSGTGMGLAIVRQIAESYGGKAVIDSERGHGTTVLVTLPAMPKTFKDVYMM